MRYAGFQDAHCWHVSVGLETVSTGSAESMRHGLDSSQQALDAAPVRKTLL